MGKYAILCYTRTPLEDAVYAEKLAYSMHLAISEDGQCFEPLNKNQGVLRKRRRNGTASALPVAFREIRFRFRRTWQKCFACD